MRYLNRHNSEFMIAHFQGQHSEYQYGFIMLYMEKSPVAMPSNIGIVTFATKNLVGKMWLPDQLKRNGIAYYNPVADLAPYEWSNTLKASRAVVALGNVKEEYALVLDGRDVLLARDLDGIVDRFAKYETRVLFGATKNNWPPIDDPPEVVANWTEPYCYLNAGTAFGRTADLIACYKKIARWSRRIENSWDSEQLVVREIYREHRDLIDFDYNSSVFHTFSKTDMVVIDDETIGFL